MISSYSGKAWAKPRNAKINKETAVKAMNHYPGYVNAHTASQASEVLTGLIRKGKSYLGKRNLYDFMIALKTRRIEKRETLPPSLPILGGTDGSPNIVVLPSWPLRTSSKLADEVVGKTAHRAQYTAA